MKRIAYLIGGLGLAYASCKFIALTYTLLEAGHTPILVAMPVVPCAIISSIFIMEALN